MFKFIFLSVNFQNYHFFTLYITYIHASSRTKLDSISRSQNGVYFVMIMNMKILFVCHGNVARSQITEAIYNKLTNQPVLMLINPERPWAREKSESVRHL